MLTLLSALYLQAAAARHGIPRGNNLPFESLSCSPAKAFAQDDRIKNIVISVLVLPSKYANLFQNKDTLAMLAWNGIGIALTVNLDLLDVASGRDGYDPAHKAMVAVAKWSQSASARRAILHIGQIFNILSLSRLRDSNIARLDLLLFVSALTLSMYLFVGEPSEEDQNSQVFELLQDVDWTAVGGEGLQFPPENSLSNPSLDYQYPPGSIKTARDFIRHGGPISFAGEDQLGGALTARKILLNYLHLLDELGKWRWSRYSQLLRTMSDFVIEGSN